MTKDTKERAEQIAALRSTDFDAYIDRMFAGEITTGYPALDRPWYKYYTAEGMKGKIPEMTVMDYIRSHPDWTRGTAFSYYENKISYEDFFRKAEEAARVLTSLGARKGDRILSMVPNIPEAAYLFYGASMIGAVSDFIDPRPDSTDLLVSARKCLSIYQEEKCSFVVTLDQCYLAMIRPNEQEWKDAGLKNVLVITAGDSMNLKAYRTWQKHEKILHGKEMLKAKKEKNKKLSKAFEASRKASILDIRMYKEETGKTGQVEPEYASYEPDMMVAITHTSGTTGRPKPIPITHDNLNAYAVQPINAKVNSYPGQRQLHLLPYFAVYGLAGQVHVGLGAGMVQIEVPEIGPSDLGKLIVLNRSNFNAGIPTWCYAMVKDPWMEGKDLSFVEWLSAGGTSMSAGEQQEVTDFIQAHGAKCEFIQGHGMSETMGSASIAPFGEPGSVGIPWPQTVYAIVDPDSKEMLAFEEGQEWLEGELVVSTPTNTSGVLDGKQYAEFREYFGEKYIMTGDIARMRRDGMMFFDSRKDRGFARFDGFNIRPGKLEEVIDSFPEIRSCVIAPYFEEKVGGNLIRAWVVTNDGKIPDAYERTALVEKIVKEGFIENSDLSSRQIPSRFRFIEAMPMTPGGKTDYSRLDDQPASEEEVLVVLEETNVSLDGVKVIRPEK